MRNHILGFAATLLLAGLMLSTWHNATPELKNSLFHVIVGVWVLKRLYEGYLIYREKQDTKQE